MAGDLVETNAVEVAGIVGRLFRDQVPYALSVAVNETAKDFQRTQREHQREIFDVRRPLFVDRAVKIKPFASKRRPEAVVRIDPPGGQERADILSKFEDQRVKRPRSGSRVAIPDEVRRTRAGVIPTDRRPAAFNFVDHGGDVAIGDQRTISIRKPGGRGVILQRTGRGKRSRLRRLYTFVPQVPIRPELNFGQNARAVVDSRFEHHFAFAFDRAVRTAR